MRGLGVVGVENRLLPFSSWLGQSLVQQAWQENRRGVVDELLYTAAKHRYSNTTLFLYTSLNHNTIAYS